MLSTNEYYFRHKLHLHMFFFLNLDNYDKQKKFSDSNVITYTFNMRITLKYLFLRYWTSMLSVWYIMTFCLFKEIKTSISLLLQCMNLKADSGIQFTTTSKIWTILLLHWPIFCILRLSYPSTMSTNKRKRILPIFCFFHKSYRIVNNVFIL